MTYAVATTSERVRTDKSDHCACARMRDMRLDESWTGRIWDHHSGTDDVLHIALNELNMMAHFNIAQ